MLCRSCQIMIFMQSAFALGEGDLSRELRLHLLLLELILSLIHNPMMSPYSPPFNSSHYDDDDRSQNTKATCCLVSNCDMGVENFIFFKVKVWSNFVIKVENLWTNKELNFETGTWIWLNFQNTFHINNCCLLRRRKRLNIDWLKSNSSSSPECYDKKSTFQFHPWNRIKQVIIPLHSISNNNVDSRRRRGQVGRCCGWINPIWQ